MWCRNFVILWKPVAVMDILDVTDCPRPVEYFANKYPGFPRFVHDIMFHVDQGKTPEEAANLSCDGLQKRLQSVIAEVEATHAYWNDEGAVELPKLVLDYIERHGEQDMALETTDTGADASTDFSADK